MLGRTDSRNKILRILCMFMLMLIHLDAYLYETIHLFQNDLTEQIVPYSEETAIQEQSPYQVEWNDLSYARTSARVGGMILSVYLLSFLYLFKSFFFKARRELRKLSSQPLCMGGLRPYVAYGSLLI